MVPAKRLKVPKRDLMAVEKRPLVVQMDLLLVARDLGKKGVSLGLLGETQSSLFSYSSCQTSYLRIRKYFELVECTEFAGSASLLCL